MEQSDGCEYYYLKSYRYANWFEGTDILLKSDFYHMFSNVTIVFLFLPAKDLENSKSMHQLFQFYHFKFVLF